VSRLRRPSGGSPRSGRPVAVCGGRCALQARSLTSGLRASLAARTGGV